MPGGQFSAFTPHSCTIGLLGMAKLEIQILSLPSTATAQGPGRPPPVKGEPGYWLPSGRNSVTLPPSALVCLDIARVNTSSKLPPVLSAFPISSSTAKARAELPNRFVTQTLPWLSIPSPLPLKPALKVSTLVGSEAGKRVTKSAMPLVTQMRSCWSIPRKNGPRSDLHGSSLKPSQSTLALLGSPLGMYTNWFFETPTTQTSVLGVTMTPGIRPSWPSKVMPSGPASDFPFLSNFEIECPP